MDLILNFTHTYSQDWINANKELKLIDCSNIEGTDMYCTAEAEELLFKKLSQYPLDGIHFIDSGNYHYITEIFTKRINEPYNLVFFDNHTDMQTTMIPDILSCGSWAKQVIENDSNLQKIIMIGPEENAIKKINIPNPDRLVCISVDELCAQKELLQNMLCGKFADTDMSLPLYVSVDKDIMSREYARTNWDQGIISLEMLKNMLEYIYGVLHACGGRAIAVDICGELPLKETSVMEAVEAERINRRTNQDLYEFLKALALTN
ncbi:MAG: arginase family protein [Lachnospiraceae bacterium]|nr:arginase family protein [Lachnospiraceae bacterium]